MSAPIPMLCLYRVKPEDVEAFRGQLAKHWDVLHSQGLVTEQRATAQRGSSPQNKGLVTFIERFSWKDRAAVEVAHENPEVMQIWEPMGALCADMEFLEVADLEL